MLVERIAAGDKLAMQVLFARHRTSVYRWLFRFVGNETIAEDLLSDVFFDVWQQAGRFEGRSAVTTWLLSIARFKALSARRRRTDAVLDETIETTVADTADNRGDRPGEEASGRGGARRLEEALAPNTARLSTSSTTTRSRSTMRTDFSIPAATVKTRMFYARKKLPSWFRKSEMLQKFLLTVALVGGALPALAIATEGTPQDRAACAPAVREFCKSANEDSMRVLACLQANRAKIGAACNKVLISYGQ